MFCSSQVEVEEGNHGNRNNLLNIEVGFHLLATCQKSGVFEKWVLLEKWVVGEMGCRKSGL